MNGLPINLATFEYRKRRVAALLLFVSGLVVLGISLYSIHVGRGLRDEIREYENRIAQLESIRASARAHGDGKRGKPMGQEAMRAIRQQASLVNQLIVSDVFPWDRLLDGLERALPDGVLLASLRPSGDRKKITITGRSQSTESLSHFMSGLEESGVIDRAALTKLHVEGRNGHSGAMTFEIDGRLRLEPGV